MLGTYFAVILLMFIVLIVGAVFGYSQSLDELKKPLVASMANYDPTDQATAEQKAVTAAWDQVQMDVSDIPSFSRLYSNSKGVSINDAHKPFRFFDPFPFCPRLELI